MKSLLIIMMLAVFLRTWGAFQNPAYIEDEKIHVTAATNMARYGVSTDMQWFQPQLSSYIVFSTISTFGDTPVGRRIGNCILGIASVLLIYLIGQRLFPGTSAPLISSALLAMDPLHSYYSRNTMMEIPVTFFFLLYFYFVLEFSERKKPFLPLAGFALGLTIATKAYFVFTIPTVAAFAIYRKKQQGELTPAMLLCFFVNLILLPLAVYLFSYYQWFARGFTLPDFIRMKMDAIQHMQTLRVEQFAKWSILVATGKPWEWFLKPLSLGEQLFSGGQRGSFLLKINNPPFWLMVIPALLFQSAYAIFKKSLSDLLIPALFLSCYLLFLVLDRPIFIYSAIAVLPFAYLGLARIISLFAQFSKHVNTVSYGILCCIIIWGLYLFPLISGVTVPLFLYRPILSITRFIGTF